MLPKPSRRPRRYRRSGRHRPVPHAIPVAARHPATQARRLTCQTRRRKARRRDEVRRRDGVGVRRYALHEALRPAAARGSLASCYASDSRIAVLMRATSGSTAYSSTGLYGMWTSSRATSTGGERKRVEPTRRTHHLGDDRLAKDTSRESSLTTTRRPSERPSGNRAPVARREAHEIDDLDRAAVRGWSAASCASSSVAPGHKGSRRCQP